MKTHNNPRYAPTANWPGWAEALLTALPFLLTAAAVVGSIIGLCTGAGWSTLWFSTILLTWAPLVYVNMKDQAHEAHGLSGLQLEVYKAYWALEEGTRAQLMRPTKKNLDGITNWELAVLGEELEGLVQVEKKRREVEFEQASIGQDWIAQVKTVAAEAEAWNRQLER